MSANTEVNNKYLSYLESSAALSINKHPFNIRSAPSAVKDVLPFYIVEIIHFEENVSKQKQIVEFNRSIIHVII